MTAEMVRRELDEYDKGNKMYPVRLVHHFGDLSYARGSAYLWDAWLDMIQPFASRIPFMVGVGNHEYDHTGGGMGKDPSGANTDDGFRPSWGNFKTDSGGECGVPIAKRFPHASDAGKSLKQWSILVFVFLWAGSYHYDIV